MASDEARMAYDLLALSNNPLFFLPVSTFTFLSQGSSS